MPIAQLEYKLDSSILTQRTLHLRVGEADVRIFCDQEAFRLRRKVSVPGFRRGNAPLPLLRKHHWKRIEDRAFSELKRAALEQVFSLLQKPDQPFLPPEVLQPNGIKLHYGQPLEFAVKYLTDPTSITTNPQIPQPQQGAVIPGHQIQHPALGGQGIPEGPRLPNAQIPDVPRNSS